MNFFNLLPDRVRQLREEARIDELLRPYIEICPVQIAQYYASRRESNRDQFARFEQAGLFDKYSVAKRHLAINEHHQQSILSHFDKVCDPCQFLDTIMEK